MFGNTAPLVEGEVDTIGGGDTDYHALYNGASRLADAILAGGTTARLSGNVRTVYHPDLVELRRSLGKKRHPIQIIVTRGNINMEEQLMFNIPKIEVIVLTTNEGVSKLFADAEKRPQVSLVSMGETSDFKVGFRQLKQLGVNHISIVGGREVASACIDGGVVTGAHITTAKEPGGRPNTPFYTGKRVLNLELVTRREGQQDEKGILYEYFVLK